MSNHLVQEFIKAEILVAKAGERRLLANRAEHKFDQVSKKLDELFASIKEGDAMTEEQNTEAVAICADLFITSLRAKMYRQESIAMAKQATEIYQRLA